MSMTGRVVCGFNQILKITSTHSAHGLSLTAYVLETLAYAITVAYSARSHFPFSTYGKMSPTLIMMSASVQPLLRFLAYALTQPVTILWFLVFFPLQEKTSL